MIANDMYAFRSAQPDRSFIDSIFAFDVRQLESIKDTVVSQYVIALSQYLIYFKAGINETKKNLAIKKRNLSVSVAQLMTAEYVKQYKNKEQAKTNLIFTNPDLNKLQLEVDALNDELSILDGIDKTISELIAAFKRELTRRENELYQQRHARV